MPQTLHHKYGSLFRTLLASFLFAFICIIFFLWITYENTQFALTENKEVIQALSSTKHLERILDDMQDLETGERGYAVTGDQSFLQPTQIALTSVNIELDQLYHDSGYNRSDLQTLKKLIVLVNKKILISGDIINNVHNGRKDEAFLFEKSKEGKDVMDEIRLIIQSLENKGRIILNKSHTEQIEKAREISQLFVFTSLLVILVLAVGFISIRRSLRIRYKTERELKKTSLTLEDLYNHAPYGYHSVNENGTIIAINDTELKMLGYTRNEIAGKIKITDLLTAESVQIFTDSFPEFKRSGKLPQLELTFRRKDQSTFPASINASALFDDDGKFLMSRSVVIDITERKASEDRIAYMAELINKSGEAIVTLDMHRIIKSWNSGAEKMYGYAAGEVIGKNIVEVLNVKMTEEELATTRKAVFEGGSWKNEIHVETKSGKKLWVAASASRMKDHDGNLQGMFIIYQDVTERKRLEEQLIVFNKNLEAEVYSKTREIADIFERVSDAFIAIDKQWNYTYVNDRAALHAGHSRGEMTGKNMWEILPVEYRESFRQSYEKAMRSKLPMHVEIFVPAVKQWFHKHFYPSANGLSVFFQDITLRKEQETLLSASEKKYRLLFENSPLPMWVYDLQSFLFLDVNEVAVRHYGYSKEEFLSMTIFEIRNQEENERLEKHLTSSVFKQGKPVNWRHRIKNGQEIDVVIYSHTITFDNRKARLVLINDVTEKLKTEREAKATHEKMRELNNYLHKVREEERTTIAREIHDELGQQMTGLKMDVSWIRNKVPVEDKPVQQRIQSMLGLIDQTVNSIRKIARELRPGILDDLGLNSALDWQCNEFEKRTGISCRFTAMVSEQNLSQEMKTGYFRVFQESLTNVARHSEATEVNAVLKRESGNLILTVKDNGKGFSQSAENKKHTLGLLGMQERAKMIGGELTIKSEPGNGCIVEINAPIEIKKFEIRN